MAVPSSKKKPHDETRRRADTGKLCGKLSEADDEQPEVLSAGLEAGDPTRVLDRASLPVHMGYRVEEKANRGWAVAVTRRTAGIISVTVRVRTPDGGELDVPVDPTEYDAVFLSRDAANNFLVPLYTARDGIDEALEFRANLERELKRRGGMGVVIHKLYCASIIVAPGRAPHVLHGKRPVS